MRLPRDLSGYNLVKALERIGYAPARQEGSHVQLTFAGPPQHHVTVPLHDTLRMGLLAAILDEVAEARHLDRAELIRLLEI